MLEIGKWILASLAWLAGILIIALIAAFKDLKDENRIGGDVALKSRQQPAPAETVVGVNNLLDKSA